MTLQNFDDFQTSKKEVKEELNPKKQFILSTQVQDSIKKMCQETLHPEAKSYHDDDDKAHTYEGYIKECKAYLKECMNECSGM
jgi:hypothetical protein